MPPCPPSRFLRPCMVDVPWIQAVSSLYWLVWLNNEFAPSKQEIGWPLFDKILTRYFVDRAQWGQIFFRIALSFLFTFVIPEKLFQKWKKYLVKMQIHENKNAHLEIFWTHCEPSLPAIPFSKKKISDRRLPWTQLLHPVHQISENKNKLSCSTHDFTNYY